MANDHNDASSVVLEDARGRTLQQLTIRAECCVEGDVDAARNVASIEAGGSRIKEHSFEQILLLSGTKADERAGPFIIQTQLKFNRNLKCP